MSEEREEMNIKIIPREDEEGRIEIFLPESPHTVRPGSRSDIEIFAPLYTTPSENLEDEVYVWSGGPFEMNMERTKQVSHKSRREDIETVLEKMKFGYRNEGYEPNFKWYADRSPEMERNFRQEVRSLKRTGVL